MSERSFVLSDLPDDVLFVEAVFEVQPNLGGYVLCRVGADEWATWRYYRNVPAPTSFVWGHYFDDREDALRDLFERTGFGRVEALLPRGAEIVDDTTYDRKAVAA